MQMPVKDLLLINLGMGLLQKGYDKTRYEFDGGHACETNIAGLALWAWLTASGRDPARVAFACTEDAWSDQRDRVDSEIQRLGLDASRITHIPLVLPRSLDDVWSLIPLLERWIRDDGDHAYRLHIDLTHGFRAIPITQAWLAVYLARLGLSELGVMGYGAYEPSNPESTPFIDLTPMIRLADWAMAVSDFRKRLDPSDLTRLLEGERKGLASHSSDESIRRELAPLRKLIDAAHAIGESFQSGLPLEAGLAAHERLRDVSRDAVEAVADKHLPALRTPLVRLWDMAAEMRCHPESDRSAKRHLMLTMAEIDRQLLLIERWLESGMVEVATRALSELMVNRVMLAQDTSAPDWLDYNKKRSPASRLLGGLSDRREASALSHSRDASAWPPEHQQDYLAIGGLWGELSNERNSFAHCGMRAEAIDVGRAKSRLREMITRFRELKDREGAWELRGITPSSRREEIE